MKIDDFVTKGEKISQHYGWPRTLCYETKLHSAYLIASLRKKSKISALTLELAVDICKTKALTSTQANCMKFNKNKTTPAACTIKANSQKNFHYKGSVHMPRQCLAAFGAISEINAVGKTILKKL